jgi:hypothetical protein
MLGIDLIKLTVVAAVVTIVRVLAITIAIVADAIFPQYRPLGIFPQ